MLHVLPRRPSNLEAEGQSYMLGAARGKPAEHAPAEPEDAEAFQSAKRHCGEVIERREAGYKEQQQLLRPLGAVQRLHGYQRSSPTLSRCDEIGGTGSARLGFSFQKLKPKKTPPAIRRRISTPHGTRAGKAGS